MFLNLNHLEQESSEEYLEKYSSQTFVGNHITECISNLDNSIDLSTDGWVSVNDILIEEGHTTITTWVRRRILKMKSKKKKESKICIK